jgi:hypothetical protein
LAPLARYASDSAHTVISIRRGPPEPSSAQVSVQKTDANLGHQARSGQQRLAVVTAKGNEVQIASFLMTLQSARHAIRIVVLRISSMTGDT